MSEEKNTTLREEDEAFLVELSAEMAEAVPLAEENTDESLQDEDGTEKYIQMIGELEDRLRAAEEEKRKRERELECLSLLGTAGLPSELMSAVILSEDMAETVELIGSTVRGLVDAEVSKRCRSEAPLAGSRASLTKEELMRMSVAELQRMRDSGIALTRDSI